MLVINSQAGSSEPEWIKVEIDGKEMLLTAFKKRTMFSTKGTSSVVVMFKAGDEFTVKRTGTFMEKRSGKTISSQERHEIMDRRKNE